MSQSVRRAARIIDALAASPRTVANLAAEFGLHRSTMFRELKALEEVGYARRRAGGTYSLGMRLAALGQEALAQVDLRGAAAGPARRLHQDTRNTVHVAALLGEEIVYVDKVEDAAEVRMRSRIGEVVGPHCSAVGKAILAELHGAEREVLLSRATRDGVPGTATPDRAGLAADLSRVAERGWASDDGESDELVNCIAVPILSSAGVVGALSVTAIRMVKNLAELRECLPQLRRAAEEVGRELG